MKWCKDCKHIKRNPTGQHEIPSYCMHPLEGKLITNFVEGAQRLSNPPCDYARTLGKCGFEGKLFEPNEVGETDAV